MSDLFAQTVEVDGAARYLRYLDGKARVVVELYVGERRDGTWAVPRVEGCESAFPGVEPQDDPEAIREATSKVRVVNAAFACTEDGGAAMRVEIDRRQEIALDLTLSTRMPYDQSSLHELGRGTVEAGQTTAVVPFENPSARVPDNVVAAIADHAGRYVSEKRTLLTTDESCD